MPDTQKRVFFSYSRSDSNFVLKIARSLRAEGRNVWVDQLDIPKGARWDEEVEKALKSSSCLLAVLSPAATNSQNVLDEVSYALDEGRKVLPILLQPTSIPFRLKRLQYIDFTGDFDSAYSQLRAALDNLPTSDSMIRPVAEQRVAPAPAAEPVVAPPVAVVAPLPSPAPAPPPAAIEGPSSRPRSMAAIFAMLSLVMLLLLGGAYLLNVMRAANPLPQPMPQPLVVDTPVEKKAPSPEPAAPPAARTVSDQQIIAFVDDYIGAQNRSSAVALLDFYGERIDYFDRAGADREFVLKDKQSFYKRWPQTATRRIADVQIDRLPGEAAARVSYLTEYRVHSPQRSESRDGRAREQMTLRFDDGRIRIVSQRQEIVGAGAPKS